jgi:hypothetical protein
MLAALNSKGLKERQMNKLKLPHYAQGCLQEPSKNDDPEMLWFCGDQYKLVLQFDETREPDWQNKITEAQAFYHRQEMPAIIKNDGMVHGLYVNTIFLEYMASRRKEIG